MDTPVEPVRISYVMDLVAFVMAGGTGKRFWPVSRRHKPKQLLSIGEHPVMIQETVDRLRTFLKWEQIYVITARQHSEALANQLSSLPEKNLIIEPEGRDTAACAGISGLVTREHFSDETIVGLFPADHQIDDTSRFETAVRQARDGAQTLQGIVTFGIEPDNPATGYGYIIPAETDDRSNDLLEVEKFIEKPARKRACRMIEKQSALWNSGIFFWSGSTILREIESSLPELYSGLELIHTDWRTHGSLNQALDRYYEDLPKVSVDYGVIERAEKTWTLPVNFGWSDLGSWESVASLLESDHNNNCFNGDVCLVDSSETVAVNHGGPMIGAVGVEELVIVSTKDALLVCPRSRTEEVKKLVESLEERGRIDLL